MASIAVRPLDVMAEATWSFRDSSPTWRYSLYSPTATFDPFPGYRHDLDDVRRAAEHVARLCPPLWNVELFVADREEMGRSNGFSSLTENSHYEGDTYVQDEPTGVIVFSGKRVPPHPAVSRYLVAHEYGHHVEWMINKSRGATTTHDEALVTEYAERRGLSDNLHHGSGGRWHDSVHEVLACDFRLLVCEVEPDYWPHPSVPRPDTVDGLARWWEDALTTVGKARGATPAGIQLLQVSGFGRVLAQSSPAELCVDLRDGFVQSNKFCRVVLDVLPACMELGQVTFRLRGGRRLLSLSVGTQHVDQFLVVH